MSETFETVRGWVELRADAAWQGLARLALNRAERRRTRWRP